MTGKTIDLFWVLVPSAVRNSKQTGVDPNCIQSFPGPTICRKTVYKIERLSSVSPLKCRASDLQLTISVSFPIIIYSVMFTVLLPGIQNLSNYNNFY